jgi:Stage II sporulation protein E (SpoIIE)
MQCHSMAGLPASWPMCRDTELRSAVLMSMIESAARASVSRHEPLVELMQHLNDSRFDGKETSMFVTLACLPPRAPGRREYSLAGHPLIENGPFSHTGNYVLTAGFPLGVILWRSRPILGNAGKQCC